MLKNNRNKCFDSKANLIAGGLLFVFSCLSIGISTCWSPYSDELAHVVAGTTICQHGFGGTYSVSPPLLQVVAALPIVCTKTNNEVTLYRYDPIERHEFSLGEELLKSNPDRWQELYIAGRLMLLPLALVGGIFCYRWGKELWGARAGIIALVLWCFSPNILTWSSTICTDGIATSFGVIASYYFWKWLKLPNWKNVCFAGIALGIVQLTKMTWLLLFLLWPVMWGMAFIIHTAYNNPPLFTQVKQLAVILLLGLYVLNLGYGFDGTFTQLGDFTFHSQILTGERKDIDSNKEGNVFCGTYLENMPVPLPKYYVIGADIQKVDFEKGKPSYLFGKWQRHGWWYYYLVGFVLKVPLGTWGLALLAIFCCVCKKTSTVNFGDKRIPLVDHIGLLLPAIAIFIFVSSQDGFSSHFRYVLPVLPFAFIWISQIGQVFSLKHFFFSALAISLILSTILSSLLVYPHSMSYFNVLAGGPQNGHKYMLGSSFSWSQDVFYLKKWLEKHKDHGTPYVGVSTAVPFGFWGIPTLGSPPPCHFQKEVENAPLLSYCENGPIPGLHVIDVERIKSEGEQYQYFLHFEPVAMAGYSIYIYHITLDEANLVREKLGLPVLPEDWQAIDVGSENHGEG